MSHINEILLVLVASWAFWPITAVLFIGFWAFSENDKNVFAVISLGILLFLTNYQFGYLSNFDTWYKVVGFVGIYAVIGAAYSFMRWYFYLRGQQNIYVNYRDSFLAKHNLPADFLRKDPATLTDDEKTLLTGFINTFKHGPNFNHIGLQHVPERVTTIADVVKHITPVANKNKATITARIAYWPTSFLWFALSDFIVELGASVYRLIGGKYQQLADSMFKEVL